MSEIEQQATRAWGSGTQAVAAWDFMRVVIPVPTVDSPLSGSVSEAPIPFATSSGGAANDTTMELKHADPVEGFLYANNRGRDSGNKKRKL